MAYYAVCYGHAVRYSKASTPEEAAKDAYGVKLDGRITIKEMRNPKSYSHKRHMEFLAPLAVKHFHRTGSILGGWEKEPGILNVHWTQCQLCRFPITTEPAAAGITEALCSECQLKYDSLSSEEQDQLSITKMREKLHIVIRGF